MRVPIKNIGICSSVIESGYKETVHDIPKRLIFPADEQTINAVNYNAAAKAIGGDAVTTKIFWDIYEANKNQVIIFVE